jgi:CSLREA domain-containing protein
MADFIVTTLADTVDATDNVVSLREALALANGNGSAESDTITFDASLAGGTLFLTSGQQLAITTDRITVDGDRDGDGDPDITIDADPTGPDTAASRVFFIDDGAATTISATLNGLVIRDGNVGNFGDGATILDSTTVGTVPTTQHVIDSGDYNGDGNADILWQDDAGTVSLWEMNGPNALAMTNVATVPAWWQIVS